jgi:hypothetical protein
MILGAQRCRTNSWIAKTVQSKLSWDQGGVGCCDCTFHSNSVNYRTGTCTTYRYQTGSIHLVTLGAHR